MEANVSRDYYRSPLDGASCRITRPISFLTYKYIIPYRKPFVNWSQERVSGPKCLKSVDCSNSRPSSKPIGGAALADYHHYLENSQFLGKCQNIPALEIWGRNSSDWQIWQKIAAGGGCQNMSNL
jgi:hypothetical protein